MSPTRCNQIWGWHMKIFLQKWERELHLEKLFVIEKGWIRKKTKIHVNLGFLKMHGSKIELQIYMNY